MGTEVGFSRYYFNLDGTLLNAQVDVTACLINEIAGSTDTALNHRGTFTERYLAGWGAGLAELIAELAGCNPKQAAALATAYVNSCNSRGFVQTTVPEDLRELLRLLRSGESQLICVSSYIPDPVAVLYEKNLHHYFHRIVNTMEARLNFWQQEFDDSGAAGAVIVSDRDIDMQFGVANKIYTAAVTWGACDMWDLGIQTPDVILSSAREAKRFFIDGVLPSGD